MRPCKAKGSRAHRVTVAYCFVFYFSSFIYLFIFQFSQGMVLLHIIQSDHGLSRFDTPSFLDAHHGLRETSIFLDNLHRKTFRCIPNWQLCYILAQTQIGTEEWK